MSIYLRYKFGFDRLQTARVIHMRNGTLTSETPCTVCVHFPHLWDTRSFLLNSSIYIFMFCACEVEMVIFRNVHSYSMPGTCYSCNHCSLPCSAIHWEKEPAEIFLPHATSNDVRPGDCVQRRHVAVHGVVSGKPCSSGSQSHQVHATPWNYCKYGRDGTVSGCCCDLHSSGYESK